eukprot:SAG31_NODE_20925_length_562_cov_0.771058_2_plen_68_part_01
MYPHVVRLFCDEDTSAALDRARSLLCGPPYFMVAVQENVSAPSPSSISSTRPTRFFSEQLPAGAALAL